MQEWRLAERDDPVQARTGAGALRVDFPGVEPLGVVWASFRAQVPSSGGAGGPALRFFHRHEGDASGSLTVSPTGIAMPLQGNWTERVLCLPPDFAGHVVDVRLTFDKGNPLGACTHWVDDVELTTDEGC